MDQAAAKVLRQMADEGGRISTACSRRTAKRAFDNLRFHPLRMPGLEPLTAAGQLLLRLRVAVARQPSGLSNMMVTVTPGWP